MVTTQLLAIVQHQDIVRAITPRSGRVRTKDQLDAVSSQNLAERLTQRRGLASEHVSGGLDEGHFAAQAPYRLRHLGTDRSTAEDEQPARDGLHTSHLAV